MYFEKKYLTVPYQKATANYVPAAAVIRRVQALIGIPCVAVKCVDIRKNTSGEGGLLDDN